MLRVRVRDPGQLHRGCISTSALIERIINVFASSLEFLESCGFERRVFFWSGKWITIPHDAGDKLLSMFNFSSSYGHCLYLFLVHAHENGEAVDLDVMYRFSHRDTLSACR